MTREQIIDKLKSYWRVDELKFIAKFDIAKNKDGSIKGDFGFFNDFLNLKSARTIFYPIPENNKKDFKRGLSFYINNISNLKLVDGDYYQITLDANIKPNDKSPYGLSITSIDALDQQSTIDWIADNNNIKKNNPRIEDAKIYVNSLRRQYEKAEGIANETIIGSLKRLTAETNKKPETFIFELIQNADDYPDPEKEDVHVSFHITNNHLVLTHDGLPFQKKNVYAICSVDAGDKKNDLNKTGFKGIGFKSIFKFSNHVWINSGDFSFKFDEAFFENRGESRPWQVIPIWTNPKKLDSTTEKLRKEPVSIFIRPTEGESKLREISRIFKTIFKNDDRVLLFLRHVKSISFQNSGSEFKIERDNNKWEISDLDSLVIPDKIKKELSISADKDDRVPDKYKNINESKITFATSLKDGVISKTTDARLYAYLPTDWNFGFDFLINGDFIPDGSRDRLFDDIEWNTYLFEETGYVFLKWFAQLVNSYNSPSVFDIYPNLNKLLKQENDRPKKTFLEVFDKGLDRALDEISFIPDTENNLQLVSDVVFDNTGILYLLPESIIESFIGDKKLVNISLSKHKTLKRVIKNEDEESIFEYEDLLENISLLGEWLLIPENNIQFIKHLIVKDEYEGFIDENIVLTTNNELSSHSVVYYFISEEDVNLLPKLDLNILHKDVYESFSNSELKLKGYVFAQFISDEILTNKEDIDNEITDFDISINFFKYLSKYADGYSDSIIDELKYFRAFDSNNEEISQISETKIFFKESIVEELINNNSLADDHLCMLSPKYLKTEEEKTFWKKLGVIQIDESNIQSFISDEICNKIGVINDNWNELYEEDKSKYRPASTTLLELLATEQNLFSSTDLDQLKALLLFEEDNELVAKLTEVNVYFNSTIISRLSDSHSFPDNHFYILPETFKHISNIDGLWFKLGVTEITENSISSFVQEEVCDNIANINTYWEEIFNDNKAEYDIASTAILELLIENRDRLTEVHYKKIKELYFFKTVDGIETIFDGTDVYFDNELIRDLYSNKCFPCNHFLILESNYLDIDGSKEFWKKLGVKDVVEPSIADFIQHEVCDYVSEINTHWEGLYDVKDNSYIVASEALLELLVNNQKKLTPDNFEKLKELFFFELEDQISTIFDGTNVYFEEERIIGLLERSSIPENHYFLISSSKLTIDNSYGYWEKFGAKSVEDSSIAKFIIHEICENISIVNEHLIELNAESESEFLEASTGVFEFYYNNKEYITDSDSKKINDKFSELYILTSESELMQVKDCFISSVYTNNADIEELLSGFPDVSLSFISDKFIEHSDLKNSDWNNLFKRIGAKKDNMEFIKDTLIPHLENISIDNIIPATKLLFENRIMLSEEIKKIDNFPILSKNGEIINNNQAIIGSYYVSEGIIKSFVQRFSFENEISSGYTDNRFEEWVSFFIDLSISQIDEAILISKSIGLLLKEDDNTGNIDTHFEILGNLIALHEQELLTSENYTELYNLKLITKRIELYPSYSEAHELLFSNEYNPKIRFEDFVTESDVNFLDLQYLERIYDHKNLIDFFKKIGIRGSFIYNKIDTVQRDEMSSKYVEWIDSNYQDISTDATYYSSSHKVKNWIEIPFIRLIKDNNINEVFWKNTFDNEGFRSAIFKIIKYFTYSTSLDVESEPTWFIIENDTIPNLLGELKKPTELYDLSLKDIIKDDSKVSKYDFSTFSVNNTTLANILGIKTSLDLELCINTLERKETLNWLKKNNIIHAIEEISDKNLSDEDQGILNKFKETGELISQTNEWLSIDRLIVVDSNFKLGITKSPWILNKEFNNLSEKLGITHIDEGDFEFETKAQIEDFNLKNRLLDRVDYLAFLQDEEDWINQKESIKEIIIRLNFYRCKRISLSYKSDEIVIEKSDFNFYNKSELYYYIGNWDKVRAAEMYPVLYNRLDLKYPVSEKVFIDLLLTESKSDVYEYFEEHNIRLPEELKPVSNTTESATNEVEQIGTEEDSDTNVEIHDDSSDENVIHEDDFDGPYIAEVEKINRNRIGLTEEEQKIKNKEAKDAAILYLEERGYDISEIEDQGYKLSNFADNDGVSKECLIRSALGGLLYLDGDHWSMLENEDVFLLISYPSGVGFKIFNSKQDLLDEELNKYLLFRIDNTKDTTEIDGVFSKLENNDAHLMMVTSSEMKKSLFDQFDEQKKNSSIGSSANVNDDFDPNSI